MSFAPGAFARLDDSRPPRGQPGDMNDEPWRELWALIREEKRWFLAPVVVTLFLLVGVPLALGPLAPLIYPLF